MTVSEPTEPTEPSEPSEPSEPTEQSGGRGDGSRSVTERVLDLFVYLPAGVLLTAMEDTSEAVAKGRTRVDEELRNAQFVGRFAVDLGWRQLKGQIESLAREARAAREPHEARAAHEAHEAHEARDAHSATASKEQSRRGERAAGTRTPAENSRPVTSVHREESHRERPRRNQSRPGTSRPGTSRPGAERHGTAPPRDPEVDRAIPDYDILAASQVVRRLDGLDHDELRAVLRHEQATRARRAIVQRAEELLGQPGSERDRPTDTGSTD